MSKSYEYGNCALCLKRRECWNPERYSDHGKDGKHPFPDKAVCCRFVIDKRDWRGQ